MEKTCPAADLRQCREMLPRVSRTFALAIRVLPGDLRDPVTVAYLLCRIADVLEDATEADPETRMAGLEAFALSLGSGTRDARLLSDALEEAQGLPLRDPVGLRLLADRAIVVRAYTALPDRSRDTIARWVEALSSGMSIYVARELRCSPALGTRAFDAGVAGDRSPAAGRSLGEDRKDPGLRGREFSAGRRGLFESVARRPAPALLGSASGSIAARGPMETSPRPPAVLESSSGPRADFDHFGSLADQPDPVPNVLETWDDLRAYAYYVAGTVGQMLTELFTDHFSTRDPEAAAVQATRLRELAVPFGLGLQFTNILQDVAEDRRRGWSYVPEDLARRHGTSARHLDEPAQRPAALRVLGDLVLEAASYLDRAMEYTLLIPRREPRVRLFCLWPTFFALRTLVRLWGEERVLLGGNKIRISRQEVRRIVGLTSASCLWNGQLRRLYRAERARLERRILLNPV